MCGVPVRGIHIRITCPAARHARTRRRRQRTGRQMCMGLMGRDPMQARGPHRFFLNNIFYD
jgi:hypothetical protein